MKTIKTFLKQKNLLKSRRYAVTALSLKAAVKRVSALVLCTSAAAFSDRA